MGNDAAYKTVRIGYVIIKLHDGMVRTLTNCKHSSLKKNLIIWVLNSVAVRLQQKVAVFITLDHVD